MTVIGHNGRAFNFDNPIYRNTTTVVDDDQHVRHGINNENEFNPKRRYSSTSHRDQDQ
jgi:hypothetical protein